MSKEDQLKEDERKAKWTKAVKELIDLNRPHLKVHGDLDNCQTCKVLSRIEALEKKEK